MKLNSQSASFESGLKKNFTNYFPNNSGIEILARFIQLFPLLLCLHLIIMKNKQIKLIIPHMRSEFFFSKESHKIDFTF